jgi:hypothetical protein
MAKGSRSENVPKEMQERFAEITSLTDAFGQEYLNEEWKLLFRQLTAALCRKRPSPLLTGKAPTWAYGIIHALAMVNFLFDSTQNPHIKSTQLSEHFGLSQNTGSAKSKQIRDLLKMHQFDPDWTVPSKIESNPMVWLLSVNGIMMDIRYAPRGAQEVAYLKGLIPYIPADKEAEDK